MGQGSGRDTMYAPLRLRRQNRFPAGRLPMENRRMRSRPNARSRLRAILRRRAQAAAIDLALHLCRRRPDPEGQGANPHYRCLRQCRTPCAASSSAARKKPPRTICSAPGCILGLRTSVKIQNVLPGNMDMYSKGFPGRRFHMGSRHPTRRLKGLSDCRQLSGLRHPPAQILLLADRGLPPGQA